MAGHMVPGVLTGLPVGLVSLYFELDGTFPNHEANPLEPKNLLDCQAKVRETGADMGLATPAAASSSASTAAPRSAPGSVTPA
jgi:phosphomannomutase